jgi:hypothetical protein
MALKLRSCSCIIPTLYFISDVNVLYVLRFSPVWFNGSDEGEDKEGEDKVYIACCTSDGQAKIYSASTPMSKTTRFNEDRNDTSPVIPNGNNSNFQCTTLDWSRLRHKEQLIVIGSEDRSSRDRNHESLRIYRFLKEKERSGGEEPSWQLLEQAGKDLSHAVRGPVNLVRFAANVGTNKHLCAIAADSIHIATIDPANDFAVQQQVLHNPDNLDNHEKCWRLCWDSSLRLFSVHGDKVYMWNRNSQEDVWEAELFPKETLH